jgi:hypothetical protein
MACRRAKRFAIFRPENASSGPLRVMRIVHAMHRLFRFYPRQPISGGGVRERGMGWR